MEKRRGGKIFLLLSIIAVLACSAATIADEEKDPVGDKLAVVNGTAITQADVDREINPFLRGSLKGEQLEEAKKKVLENLINMELLYQQAQKEGMKIDETVLNERLEGWKKRFKDEEELKKVLERINLSEAELKTNMKRGMLIQEIISQKISPKISVSEEEAKLYYDTHINVFKKPDEVKASHILIKVEAKADEAQKAEARKKIEDIQKRVKKGEDFAALAKEFSQCPSSAKGGDLGYFRRGQMVKPFEDAAFKLKPGELSDIVKTSFGFHLIKVTDKKPGGTTPYETVKGRVEQFLKNEKTQKETELYLEEIKKDAKIERFSKETTEQPAEK